MSHREPALLTTISYDGRWKLSLRGEVDAASRGELCHIAGLLSEDGDPIDFDLGAVGFVDKSGWAAICAAADVARRAGVEARVVNPSRAVRRLTDLLKAAHPSGGRQQQVPRLAPVA